jgi:hypothetical protein
MDKLLIVVPCYNEEEVLVDTNKKLCAMMRVLTDVNRGGYSLCR